MVFAELVGTTIRALDESMALTLRVNIEDGKAFVERGGILKAPRCAVRRLRILNDFVP